MGRLWSCKCPIFENNRFIRFFPIMDTWEAINLLNYTFFSLNTALGMYFWVFIIMLVKIKVKKCLRRASIYGHKSKKNV